MSEYVEKAEEFKATLMGLLEKYEVGVWGTMHFRIGDQELLLDTTQAMDTAAGTPCCPGGGEGCNHCKEQNTKTEDE